MNKCIQKTEILEWVTKSKTTLIHGTAPNSYRPITCLAMMWKILTAQIRENIYNTFISRKDAVREPESEELLYIDQRIPKESKTRRKKISLH